MPTLELPRAPLAATQADVLLRAVHAEAVRERVRAGTYEIDADAVAAVLVERLLGRE